MVYGKTPFSHLSVVHKFHKIIDPSYEIDYPPLNDGTINPILVHALQSCLKREIKDRYTIPKLLQHPFLHPDQLLLQLSREVKCQRDLILKEQ